VSAYSSQSFAQAQAAPARSASPAAADDTAAAEQAVAGPEDKHDVGASRLESDLRNIEKERAEYSRFWPWFTLTAGAAMTVGGVAVGAGYVFGCDNGCSTPAWIGIIVAAGTLVATLGTIWVVNANADVREIDSQHYQLEQEIERIRVSAKLPNALDNQGNAPLVSWRFALN
jgi:hypothetical protein